MKAPLTSTTQRNLALLVRGITNHLDAAASLGTLMPNESPQVQVEADMKTSSGAAKPEY
jgi:hypothetical protein